MTSWASGRYEIAEVMSRVFPAYKLFAAGVLALLDRQAPTGPYPTDNVNHVDEKTVEFTTPARSEGLGNFDSWIGRNDLPIRGVVILTGDLKPEGDGPDLVRLAVRLPPNLAGLAGAIIHQAKRESK